MFVLDKVKGGETIDNGEKKSSVVIKIAHREPAGPNEHQIKQCFDILHFLRTTCTRL